MSKRRNKQRQKNKSVTPTVSNPRKSPVRGATNESLRTRELPTTTTIQKVEEFHQGPIPDPHTLERYEKISSGFAERIVSMAEGEQRHRHSCEKVALEQNVKNHQERNNEIARGQKFGLIIGLTAIAAGTYLAINGQQIAASFIGGGGVASLVAVFVYGRKQKAEKESAEK